TWLRLWFYVLYSLSLFVLDHHLAPHPFPTRRSSDLVPPSFGDGASSQGALQCVAGSFAELKMHTYEFAGYQFDPRGWLLRAIPRSEEHTSELQSHLNLVCRLLLEKKKHQTLPTIWYQ